MELTQELKDLHKQLWSEIVKQLENEHPDSKGKNVNYYKMMCPSHNLIKELCSRCVACEYVKQETNHFDCDFCPMKCVEHGTTCMDDGSHYDVIGFSDNQFERIEAAKAIRDTEWHI